MVLRSRYAEVVIPDVALTPFVLRNCGDRAERPALIDGPSGRTITYGQLAMGVRLIAASLQRRGLRKGDRFAIYSPNIPEYAVAFHAISLAGGTVTTVNPLYTAGELATQLIDSGARFLLTVPPLLEQATVAARQAGIEELFVFGEADGATPLASLLGAGGPLAEVPIATGEDVVALPYSSGTTGLPKGVMLTHRNMVANICQTESFLPAGDQVLIGVLPFYHSYGLTVLMNIVLYLGLTIVTVPRFDLEQFLGTLARYGVTAAYLVPPIILALAKHPLVDRFDLSKLRRITSGAAPLDLELALACQERLGCQVGQGYGLTETSPVVSTWETDPARVDPGSVGALVPNTECRVVDPLTGVSLEPGEPGELWFRGPQVMKGYWRNPAATAETIDPDGWLHTGDVGLVDQEGHLHVVDRVKELIKYKGYQVAPAELEGILLSHPAIADAAVIPVPDREAGEIPKAFIVLKAPLTAEQVIAFIAERVSPQKRVRQVEMIDAIPRATSGKILRRILVERERARLSG